MNTPEAITLVALLAGTAGGMTDDLAAAEVKAATTIDELVAQAVAENPEIEFYEAEIELGEADLKTAGTRENPALSVGAGHKRVNSGGIANGYAFTASMSQRIEFPQRIQLRKSIANGQIELARLGLEKFRATIANRIRAAAFGWQAASGRAAETQAVAERTDGLLKALTQRDPAGVAPLLERRVIEAHLVQLKRQAREFESEAAQHRRELNYLVGAPLTEGSTMAAMRPALSGIPSDAELFGLAEAHNFDLKFHSEEIAQQGFRVKLALHERLPEVTLQPFFARETGGGSENIVGLGFSLPLPLWNRNEGAIDAVKAREKQLQASLGAAVRKLHRDLVFQAETYRSKLRQLADWDAKSIDEFKKAAELGDRHFRLGAIDVSTYLELQTQYLDAIDSLLDLKEEAYEALLELELLTGARLMGKEGK